MLPTSACEGTRPRSPALALSPVLRDALDPILNDLSLQHLEPFASDQQNQGIEDTVDWLQGVTFDSVHRRRRALHSRSRARKRSWELAASEVLILLSKTSLRVVSPFTPRRCSPTKPAGLCLNNCIAESTQSKGAWLLHDQLDGQFCECRACSRSWLGHLHQ